MERLSGPLAPRIARVEEPLMPLKVLVVEDDVPTLDVISEVLTSLRVDVRPFSDSEQAAETIGREKFDGVFLDLIMPKVDGFELAQRIRRSPSNSQAPIVVITGRDDKDTMEKAFAAGATFFLHKPVDRRKLIRLLDSTRGAMLEERRRYKRVSVRTQVTCHMGSRKVMSSSANISQAGMLFEGDGSLEPGAMVHLSFSLPPQKLPIEADAIVVRVDERKRVGVRFTTLKPENRQRIRNLIDSQLEAS